jgi:hypothetical protein
MVASSLSDGLGLALRKIISCKTARKQLELKPVFIYTGLHSFDQLANDF